MSVMTMKQEMTAQPLEYPTAAPRKASANLRRISFALALGPLVAGLMVLIIGFTFELEIVRILGFVVLALGCLSSLASLVVLIILLVQAKRCGGEDWHKAKRTAWIMILVLVVGCLGAVVLAQIGFRQVYAASPLRL